MVTRFETNPVTKKLDPLALLDLSSLTRIVVSSIVVAPDLAGNTNKQQYWNDVTTKKSRIIFFPFECLSLPVLQAFLMVCAAGCSWVVGIQYSSKTHDKTTP